MKARTMHHLGKPASLRPLCSTFLGLFASLLLIANSHARIFVAANSTWQYLRGTNEASAPTDAWREMTFDAAAWQTGSAPFHYGTNIAGGDDTLTGGTILGDMRGNYTCLFLRQGFVLADTNDIRGLLFNVWFDDGLAVWINGQFVYSNNFKTLAFTNTAISQREAVRGTINLNKAIPFLRTGSNMLCLQVFNYSRTDNDFQIDAELAETPSVISFASNFYTVYEDAGAVLVQLIRTNALDGGVTVNYATTNGTALAGEDYEAMAGTLTFAQGQTEQTLSIPILSDAWVEPTEDFQIKLSDPGGGATLGSLTNARVQIESGQPVIIAHPATAVVPMGQTVSFSVDARGYGTLEYRWQKSVGDLFYDIGGATDSTLNLNNVQTWQAGDYRVIVNNQIGSATSLVARLYVLPPPSLTNQLVLDDFDDNTVNDWGSTGGPIFAGDQQVTLAGSWPGQVNNIWFNTFNWGIKPFSWEIADGQVLEWRTDVVRRTGPLSAVQLSLYRSADGSIYTSHFGTNWITIEKLAVSSSLTITPFVCDPVDFRNTNVVFVLRLTRLQDDMVITVRVLDKDNEDVVLYERSFVDTPQVDPSLNSADLFRLTGMDLITAPDSGPPVNSGDILFLGIWQYSSPLTNAAVSATFDNFELWQYQIPPPSTVSCVITNPASGTLCMFGNNLQIQATALSALGVVTQVDFFVGELLLGSASAEPYNITVGNLPLGTNVLHAIARDNTGETGVSASVRVVVLNPGLTLVSPPDGVSFPSASSITVSAIGLLPSATITNVEFFVDDQFLARDNTAPFTVRWRQVTPGVHRFVAVGNDNQGRTYRSETAYIGVAVPSNWPPYISLLTPTNGASFFLPAAIPLAAEALDIGGTVGRVDFFAGSTLIGTVTNAPWRMNAAPTVAGEYVFTAVATDNEGAQWASSSVSVTVFPSSQRWAAYNDHYAGPGSHAHATTWNVFGTDDGAPGSEGFLRNIGTGDPLSAYLTTYAFGAFGDTVCGAPLPGTPAYDLFTGFVDFGSSASAGEKHAILIDRNGMVMHLFTGLNPQRLYNLRVTVVGGFPEYSNRWTLFTLCGADNYQSAHTANVLASTEEPGLAPNEAAMNTGDNRSGDVIGWDSIVPGPNGSIFIVSSQYLGPAPGNEKPGAAAYAPVAVMLEEIGPSPMVTMTQPSDGEVLTGVYWSGDTWVGTNIYLSAESLSLLPVTNMVFYANDLVVGQCNTQPFNFHWTNPPFGDFLLTAEAFDSDGSSTRSPAIALHVITPPTNLTAVVVYGQFPLAGMIVTNLTNIQVTFSQPVYQVDARDLLINDMPATSVTGSGANYTFFFPLPPDGPVRVRWASDHDIFDRSWPVNLPFDETGPGASWDYEHRSAPMVLSKTPAPGIATNLTQITVRFTEPVTGVDAVDLLMNKDPAYEVSGAGNEYTFLFSQTLSRLVQITWATNHDIRDLAGNLFEAKAVGSTWAYQLDSKTFLVGTNDYYRYTKGTNEASMPVSAWRQVAFDDSKWLSGQAPFFFKNDTNGVIYSGNTLLSDMCSNYSSVFLRTTFAIQNISAVTNLLVRFRCDDGAIAWINGVEVWRYNMPVGEPAFDGVSVTNVNDPTLFSMIALTNPGNYLLEGTNVLACQIFNSGRSDSDLLFDLELYNYVSDLNLYRPRMIAKQPAATLVSALTNITVSFSEPVKNVDATDLLINSVPAANVSSTTNTVYTFAFPQPPNGPVVVSWAPDHGIVDFDLNPKPFVGTNWQYVLYNSEAPFITSMAPAKGATITQLTELAVTFNKPVAGLDAEDLLINGVPAVTKTGSGSDYLFVFPQPAYGTVLVQWAANHGISELDHPANAFQAFFPSNNWTYKLIDRTAPAVASQAPEAGDFIQRLTQITVQFTEPVYGVNAGDLLLNGKPATIVSGSGAVYTFGFPQLNAALVQVTWAAKHGICDVETNYFDAGAPGATWSYSTTDDIAPSLANIYPPRNRRVQSLTQVRITFDEPVTGISPGDLRLNDTPATQVTGSGAGPYTFVFSEPAPGMVQLAWAPGHGIQDQAVQPNGFVGTSWSYVLDPALPYDFAVNHLVHISLDGVGAVYLEDYLENAPEFFPNFQRLRAEGASTLNARCDYDYSVTLPNHASMMTARPVLQQPGWTNTAHHGLTIDSDNFTTIHDPRTGNPDVPYKQSVFDAVHDQGGSTAFLYSKQSLSIFARSWPDKIDTVFNSTISGSYGPTAPVVDEFISRVESNDLWNFSFLHFDDGDASGHASSWGSTAYSNAVQVSDLAIGRVLEAIETHPVYSQDTIVIVTADHGGGSPPSSHNVQTSILNYRVPMFIWGKGIPAGIDLYSLLSNRADPGTNRYTYSDGTVDQPLHNADSCNIAVALMGLPPIPGSSMRPSFRTEPIGFNLAKSGTNMVVSWSATAKGYDLWTSSTLSPSEERQRLNTGIINNGTQKMYIFPPPPQTKTQFFYLRKP